MGGDAAVVGLNLCRSGDRDREGGAARIQSVADRFGVGRCPGCRRLAASAVHSRPAARRAERCLADAARGFRRDVSGIRLGNADRWLSRVGWSSESLSGCDRAPVRPAQPSRRRPESEDGAAWLEPRVRERGHDARSCRRICRSSAPDAVARVRANLAVAAHARHMASCGKSLFLGMRDLFILGAIAAAEKRSRPSRGVDWGGVRWAALWLAVPWMPLLEARSDYPCPLADEHISRGARVADHGSCHLRWPCSCGH